MRRMAKKIYMAPEVAELTDRYIKERSQKELVTNSRIVEDALLLYIFNDPLADEDVKAKAKSMYNERNRFINYTSLEAAGKQAL